MRIEIRYIFLFWVFNNQTIGNRSQELEIFPSVLKFNLQYIVTKGTAKEDYGRKWCVKKVVLFLLIRTIYCRCTAYNTFENGYNSRFL